MSRQPRASGYFRTTYTQDFSLFGRAASSCGLAVFVIALLAFPLIASPFQLDLACQAFLAAIGSLSLMLLTGYAGQISLGHAGLIAAGAFTVGILFRETNAPFWITLPAAALVGALLGIIFGLPSLRLRGLYLAVSTLALHFVVIYLGGEYETRRGFSTGIVIDPPTVGDFRRLGRARVVFHPAGSRRPRRSSSAPISCVRAPAAHGAPSARMRRLRKRSASILPATSCSPSSSARASPRSPARCLHITAALSRSRRSRCF